MKFANKFFSLTIMLLAIFYVNSARVSAQSEWVLKSTGINFNSVQFYDEMLGWVVGDSGSIIATADGGSNWQCLTSGTSQSLKSVFFINAFTGWAAGNGGVIVKTTDGGESWTALTTGTALNFSGIYFPTIDTGYAAGPSVTLKTTNGGTSWTSLLSLGASAVYFSSGSTGMVTVSTSYLSRTSNGGTVWVTNSAPGNPVNRHCMSFINANTGWAGGGYQVFKTTNNGLNWVTQTSPATTFSTFFGISFADDMTGYMVGSSGQILKSSNGGTNWSSQTSGTTKELRAVDFVDDMTGWAVGNEGHLLNTSDGGATWTKQLIQYSSPFTQTLSLFDIQFKSEMTGYTCGMDGYFNRTTNGGNDWTTISTASFNYLFSIYFPEGNDTGWACGRLGTIQKTNNGGINWVTQSSGTSQHLNSIVVDNFGGIKLKNGYCVGDNGTILATDTVGFLWSSQVSGTTNHLNSIHVFNDSEAIAAGNAGTILATSNGGSTSWVTLTSGTSADLKSIYFLNTSTGYVCGSSGTIRKTIDAGASWTAQTSGTTSTLNSIDFEETVADNGYAVGENGTIVSTTNAGLTWINESSGSTTTLFSVIASDVPSASIMLSTIIKTVGKLAKYAYKKAVAALPVELTSFNHSINGNNVSLYWQTSGEINNRGFDIERKLSANNEWTRISFVNGYGTASELKNYTYLDRNLNSGKYGYRLKQIDYNGNYEYFNLNTEAVIGVPEDLIVYQNYPNPFNPSTKIRFDLPSGLNANLSDIKLAIYDALGKEVQVLLNKKLSGGYYEVEFNGKNLSSGVYFYRIQSETFSIVKSMLLLK